MIISMSKNTESFDITKVL